MSIGSAGGIPVGEVDVIPIFPRIQVSSILVLCYLARTDLGVLVGQVGALRALLEPVLYLVAVEYAMYQQGTGWRLTKTTAPPSPTMTTTKNTWRSRTHPTAVTVSTPHQSNGLAE
jgi:hypothetical protein